MKYKHKKELNKILKMKEEFKNLSEKKGCGKHFTYRTFRNSYNLVCGYFFRYGSKKRVYCDYCKKLAGEELSE